MRRFFVGLVLLFVVSGCGLIRRDGVGVGWEFKVHRPPVVVTRTPHIVTASGENYGLTTLGARGEPMSISPPALASNFSAPVPAAAPIATSYPPPAQYSAPPPRPLTCEELVEILRRTLETQQRMMPQPIRPAPGVREERVP